MRRPRSTGNVAEKVPDTFSTTEITASLQVPAVKERLVALGFEFVPNTPAQFADYLQKEVVKWGKVVKDSGARVD